MTAIASTGQPVLIVWEHGGQLGHIARLLPIARALRARGVSVTLAVAHPGAVADFFPDVGISIVQAPRVAVDATAQDSALCPADIWLRCGMGNPPRARECVLQWLALFDALNPLAVLVDACPLALYAAQVAGLLAVAIGHGFELPPADPGLCFAPWQQDVVPRVAHSERVLQSALFSLGQTLQSEAGGRAQGDSVAQVLGAATSALCTWPALDHFDRDPTTCLGSQATYLGPIWHELARVQRMDWPDRSGAKVLCYLNLVDKRHDWLWQALQALQANVLVVTPEGEAWACDAARGWSITVCARTVALGPLLQEADAVVGHGGMGLTGMALHAGKPLLLLPNQLEQGLLAYQLTRRGLAISSLNHLNKKQVRARVDQLLHDAELKGRAGRFAQAHAAYRPEQAVERVVQLLLDRPEAHSPGPKKVKEQAAC